MEEEQDSVTLREEKGRSGLEEDSVSVGLWAALKAESTTGGVMTESRVDQL